MIKQTNAFGGTKRRTKSVFLPESEIEVELQSLGAEHIEELVEFLSDPEVLDQLQSGNFATIAVNSRDFVITAAIASSQSEDHEAARESIMSMGLEDVGELILGICEATFSKGLGHFLSNLKTRLALDGISGKTQTVEGTATTVKTNPRDRTDAEADLAPMIPMSPDAFVAS